MLETPSPVGGDRIDPLPLGSFKDAVARSVVALDVFAADPGRFRGALAGGTTGSVHVLDISSSAHAVHRTEALIRDAPQHYYKFTVIGHGSGFIVQDGRIGELSAGAMTVYDTDRPYSLVTGSTMRMSVVMVPKELLDLPAEAMRRLTATRIESARGIGAIVRPYITELAERIRELDQHTARRLTRSAIDLLGALLSAILPPQHSPHETLLQRVIDYIDEHLDSAELTPPQIAASHYVSLRHLHGLFSEQGTTVSTVIRTRRLERSYDLLVDPMHRQRSVTAIAQDNGFVDAAHFSRTFRAHYGVPPSAVRPQG